MLRRTAFSPTVLLLAVLFFLGLNVKSAYADWYGWLPNFRGIVENGRNEILLSGYAWHDPASYSAAARAQLNSFAFGGGYERYIINSDGSTELLSGIVFADSYRKPQITVGYTKYWSAKVVDNLSLGLGYTAALSRREDAFHGFPEPIVLPVGVVTIAERFQIYATYIPPLPRALHLRGDVAIIFAGVRF